MADAADEASHPLRYFDNEEYDVTMVHEMLLLFLNRIHELFGEARQCLKMGYDILYTSH